MTIAYDHNTSGASNQAAVWNAVRTVLLAAGWTETTISTGAGTRKSAFTGIALDQTAANAPVIIVGENVASNLLYFNTCSDFDTGTKTAVNLAGDATSTSGLVTSATQNTWWIRANGYAVFINVLTGASAMWKCYAGWFARGHSVGRGGMTKATGTLAIGNTVINVASSMVGKLVVGQKVQVLNFAHASANANAANCELVTISAISASQLTVSALTKAYDAGAIIGDRVMNVGVLGNCFVDWGTVMTPLWKNGTRSSATGNVAAYGQILEPTAALRPDTATGEYPHGHIYNVWSSGSGAQNGGLGRPFHVIQSYFGPQAYNDILNDALRTYNMMGIGTNIGVYVASDGVGGTTYPLMAPHGTLEFDLDGETASPGVPVLSVAPTATAGNAQATLTWTAATSDWPNLVTGYRVTAYPGGVTATFGNVTTGTISGLTNGVAVSFTVRPTNVVGDGNESPQSNTVTPSATATVPDAPTSFAVTPTGTSGFLTWLAPANNGGSALTGYDIAGLPGGTVSLGVVNGYVATGLTPGTTYSLTIVAKNSVGSSVTASASLAIAAAVPGAPQSPAISSITSTTATFSWSAPASNGGSAVTGYIINGHPAGPTTVSAGTTSLALTGLTPGAAYAMTVLATNTVGSGPTASASFSASTVVPTAPLSVTATANGATEALVQWEDPSTLSGLAILDYTITGLPGGTVTLAGTANSYLATGLAPGTTYTAVVSARNSVGSGATAGATFTTGVTVPSVPLTFAAGSITSTTAGLSWTDPSSNGGSALTGFVITRLDNGDVTSVSAGTHSTTVTGLTPGASYIFTIYATNAQGNSITASVSFTTSDIVPTAPLGFEASITGTTTATVSWAQPANNGGGAITGYTLDGLPGGPLSLGPTVFYYLATGLTPGSVYALTLTASNIAGTGPAATAPLVVAALPAGGGAGASAVFAKAQGEEDFGEDVSTFPALDTTFSTIGGFRVLAEALARRLITPKGLLTFHPDYGFDLRQFLNEAIDDTALARIKQGVIHEILQDERVADADATVVYTESTQGLAVTCHVVTAQGPFTFVLALTSVTVDLYLGAT